MKLNSINSIFIFTNSGRHFVQWLQFLARYQLEFLNKVIEMLIASIDVRLLKKIYALNNLNLIFVIMPKYLQPQWLQFCRNDEYRRERRLETSELGFCGLGKQMFWEREHLKAKYRTN